VNDLEGRSGSSETPLFNSHLSLPLTVCSFAPFSRYYYFLIYVTSCDLEKSSSSFRQLK